MSFSQAISSGFRKYATFEGRASRSEFWWFIVFYWICYFVAGLLDNLFGFRVVSGETFGGTNYVYVQNVGWITTIVALLFVIPVISVCVRRLHDTDRSGWWWWLTFLCCVGPIILIVWFATAGTPGPNRFGNPPTGAPPA